MPIWRGSKPMPDSSMASSCVCIAAAAQGVIAPNFLVDKTLGQLKIARGGDVADWSLVGIAGQPYEGHAGKLRRAGPPRLRAGRIAPALGRQIAKLEAHRKRATSDAGVWKLAAGAMRITPGRSRYQHHDTHDAGADPREGPGRLRSLQSEMDAILKREGLTQGTVGERMTSLVNNLRFRFPRGRHRPSHA